MRRLCLALCSWCALPMAFAAVAPAPGALDILETSIGFRTTPGNGQALAYANYLRALLLDAGFASADLRVRPFGEGKDATATFTARYPGRDRAKKPLLLLGHLDVVDARREDWQRDPFTAVVENGYVFGRGSYDNKFDITMMVTVLARLHRAGWRPARDVVLVLTGDEETNAASSAALAREFSGAELALNGDSGGGRLSEGDGAAVFYGIQAGEKTYSDFTLTALDEGGHSSRPTKTNAIYRLARALERIEAHDFPVDRNELSTASFKAAAPNTPGALGDAMRRYVADPDDASAIAVLSADPGTVGQLRTTCVATQVTAGHAPNALPQRAVATVNCRIFPGTPADAVRRTLIDVVADPTVSVTYDVDLTIDSAASPLRADVLAAVTRAVHARHPGVPVVPVMSAGATDGTHFRRAGVPTYAVSGLFLKSSDEFAHGENERVPLAAIDDGLAHWESLLRDLAR